MRVLVLSKRRPMGRDLLIRPYGRFHHVFKSLSASGHEVAIALLDYGYGGHAEKSFGHLRVISTPFFPSGGLRYLRCVRRLIGEMRPDWIIGASDTYFGILAEHYGRLYGLRSLIDAYDNFEGYIPWCWPLHVLWRNALRGATAVTAAGPALLEVMTRERADKPCLVVPMAVDPIGFRERSRIEARRALELPEDATLVGYCGSVFPSRGMAVLFDAVAKLKRRLPAAQLVLSGRLHGSVRIPDDALWLGYLADAEVPLLISSLDVLAVPNKASKFGNFSYPVKLYEAMSCAVPVVATRTPATEWILAAHPELLFRADDASDLASTLAQALQTGRIDYGHQQSWHEVAARLEKFLLSQPQLLTTEA